MKMLIWSIEHGQWWRMNSQGYTPHRNAAGVYTLAQATEIVNSANIACGNTPNEAMVPADEYEPDANPGREYQDGRGDS